jgi:uncharacterized membrane protein (Fun14 family)
VAERDSISEAFDLNRAISNGLTAVRISTGPMWVAGMLMSIADGCGSSVPTNLSSLWSGNHTRAHLLLAGGRQGTPDLRRLLESVGSGKMLGYMLGLVVAFLLVAVVIGLCLFALNCWATTGFIRLHVSILERAGEELAPLFTGRDRFWAMAGYKLLSGLSISATAIATSWPGALLACVGYASHRHALLIGGIGLVLLCALPALAYVALGTYLGELAVVLEGASPSQALRRSWALARGNRMPLLLFSFVCSLLQAVSVFGLLLCCVGVLATVPLGRALVGLAKTESFLLFTRGREQTNHWRLWHRLAAEDHVEPVAGWGAPPGRPPEPPAI